MLKKVIYLIFILVIVSSTCGSCNRYHQAGYHGPNRTLVKPPKKLKRQKPKANETRDKNEELVTHLWPESGASNTNLTFLGQ